MAVQTTKTNKPLNPRGNDQSPKGYNRAALYSGKALDFDGVNDYVDGGTLDITGYTQMSVSLYMNVDTTTQDFRLISIRYSGADDIRIFHSVSIGGGVLNFSLDDGDVDNIGVNFETNKWHHVVMTHDGTTLKAYFNGVEQASTASTFDYANADGLFYVGRYTGGDVTYYDGEASNVKIFNTALTAAQVADLYNNPEKVVPTGVDNTALKLWLPMQEGEGTTAYDGSGNGNHGTISGATWTHGIGAPVSQTAVIDWNKGTNLLAYSEEFSNAYWGKLNSLPSSEETGVTAPNGNGSVTTRFTFSASNHIIRQYIPNYGSYKTSAGVWVYIENKGTGGTELAMDWGDGTGKVFDVAGYDLNTWYKLEFEDITRGPFDFFDIGANASGTAPNGLQARFWGAHLNLGTTLGAYVLNNTNASITSPVLLPQGLTTGRDITGVNLFENVRKQGALNLDGNSWAEVHDNESLDFGTGSFSLEIWSKAKYITSGSIYNVLLTLGDNVSSGSTSSLYIDSSLNYTFRYDSTLIVAGGSSEGDWSHVVGVYDGTNINIYLNGSFVVQTAASATSKTNTYSKRIGTDTAGASRTYKDQLAQPRIYNRALTAEEVQRNYNAGKNIYQ